MRAPPRRPPSQMRSVGSSSIASSRAASRARSRPRPSSRPPARPRSGPTSPRSAGGESIGELFGRVLPALARLVDEDDWHTALAVLHGGVNRAILSYALTGERMFLGHFEQAPACVNVLDLGDGGEWIVRAGNISAYDLLHLSHRSPTMERYW